MGGQHCLSILWDAVHSFNSPVPPSHRFHKKTRPGKTSKPVSWRLCASRCIVARTLLENPMTKRYQYSAKGQSTTAQCQEWTWAKNIGSLHFHAADIQNQKVNSHIASDVYNHPILIFVVDLYLVWTQSYTKCVATFICKSVHFQIPYYRYIQIYLP